ADEVTGRPQQSGVFGAGIRLLGLLAGDPGLLVDGLVTVRAEGYCDRARSGSHRSDPHPLGLIGDAYQPLSAVRITAVSAAAIVAQPRRGESAERGSPGFDLGHADHRCHLRPGRTFCGGYFCQRELSSARCATGAPERSPARRPAGPPCSSAGRLPYPVSARRTAVLFRRGRRVPTMSTSPERSREWTPPGRSRRAGPVSSRLPTQSAASRTPRAAISGIGLSGCRSAIPRRLTTTAEAPGPGPASRGSGSWNCHCRKSHPVSSPATEAPIRLAPARPTCQLTAPGPRRYRNSGPSGSSTCSDGPRPKRLGPTGPATSRDRGAG